MEAFPSPIAPKPNAEPWKRLVPKKSKLAMLSGGKKEKERGKDLSDVVWRLGAKASTGQSFDIYVDPTDDPDIGEIVVVKKKKSRAAFDGLWGGSNRYLWFTSWCTFHVDWNVRNSLFPMHGFLANTILNWRKH